MKHRLITVVGFAVACAACDSTPKERVVHRENLERTIQSQLYEKGKYNPPVFCPREIDARVGAQVVCYLPIAGSNYDVTATVTDVKGTDVDFDIEVATVPRSDDHL